MATKVNWELRRMEEHNQEVGSLEETKFEDLTEKEKLNILRKEDFN